MKQETEKKLVEIILNIELGTFRSISEEDKKTLLESLNAVMTCEQSVTMSGKIDLQRYTDKEYYMGVLHEEGRMIATDGHILVNVKADYSPELEGKAIGKDGTDVTKFLRGGRYPNWKSIIPDVSDWNTSEINFQKLANLIAGAKAHRKIHGKHAVAYIKIADKLWFDLELFEKLAKIMKAHQCNTFSFYPVSNFPSDCRPIVVKSDTLTALLQPVLFYEDEEHDEYVFSCQL